MQNPIAEIESKTQIAIGVLGQDGHGKSTLAAAVYAYLSYENRKVEEGYEVTINIGSCREEPSLPFVYESDDRRDSIYDFASHIDVVKNLMLNWIPLTGAILVVSAVDGVTDQTRQQVRLAAAVSVAGIVVFLSKCDLSDDPELLDLAEVEVREMLVEHGYAGDSPVIRGRAGVVLNTLTMRDADHWRDKLCDLLGAMDASVHDPINLAELPFLMQIEDYFTITGRGTVVTGYVERGSLRINAPVEIVGFGPTSNSVATDMEQRHKKEAAIYAGENAGVMLQGISRTDLQRGQVLAEPGIIQTFSRFRAEMYLCTRLEGGRDRHTITTTTNLFRIRTGDVNGTLVPDYQNVPLSGGVTIEATAELETPIALERGVRFSLRADGRATAFGIVTEVQRRAG